MILKDKKSRFLILMSGIFTKRVNVTINKSVRILVVNIGRGEAVISVRFFFE